MGYQVRVMRNGKQYSKFFKRGRGAKQNAIAYERELLDRLGPPKSQIGRTRSRSVNRGLWESEVKGGWFVCASSRTPEGKPKTIMVSIRKHGKRAAYRIAREKKQAADKVAYSACG